MFIKKAAILYNTIGVIEGTSYSEIATLALKMGVTTSSIYGFVDSTDNFIDRVKALEIAKTANQVPANFDGPLYPEDLFGETENAVD